MAQKKEYDANVVGSGPGGASVAKELSQAGKKVLIVEWGAHKPIKGNAIQSAFSVFKPGKSLLFTPDFASVFRGIYHCVIILQDISNGTDFTVELS